MECGIYGCPARWAALLPRGVRRLRTRSGLRARRWDILALTPEGRRDLLAPEERRDLLTPEGRRDLLTPEGRRDLLAPDLLTPDGGRDLLTDWRGKFRIRRSFRGAELSCGLLLAPGNCPAEWLSRIRADFAVSYGLSARDSLTFSSLEEPVLCVQRALPGPDGTVIEPQEIPLPGLPAPVERYLPLLGLWLLCG